MIEELLGEGNFDSHGTFTQADPEKLRQLSRNLLPDPKLYLVKGVQALVAGGASAINVRSDFTSVIFEAQGLRPLQLGSNWLRPIFEGAGTAVERHLCSALLAGWDEFVEAEVSWCGIRWLFRPADGLAAQPQPPLAGPSFVRFRPRRWFMGRIPQWTRLHACPVPIYEGSNTWQSLAYLDHGPDPSKWWAEGTCVAVACVQERGLLTVMQTATDPMFFEPPQTFGANHLIPVRRLYCLSLSKGPSLILPVEAGLVLNPIPVELSIPGLRCLVSVESEGLATDLSQFQVREDSALAALRAFLQEEAARLLAIVAQNLPTWKPPLTFNNGSLTGGLVGLVGGTVAGSCAAIALGASGWLCLLGLPVAAVGAHLMKRRWSQLTQRRLEGLVK